MLDLTLLWQMSVVSDVPSVENLRVCDSVDLDVYLQHEAHISVDGVLANLAPDGEYILGKPAGILIASPSNGENGEPEYLSTWTRDSSLTFKVLVELFIGGNGSLRPKIDDWVALQGKLQLLSNPSGFPNSGGLGDPRFEVDGTTAWMNWARPQRDGPALRATTLTLFSNWLISNGETAHVLDQVWPIISKDLAYTARYWNQTGFDLWEESWGSSFFTVAASHRALVEGAALAKRLGHACALCESTSPEVLCFLQSFWTGTHITSQLNYNQGWKHHDLDSSTIISSIHTFDPEANCDDATLQPCSSRALANLKVTTEDFRSYKLNEGISLGKAIALGRYNAGDEYYGGNPCTSGWPRWLHAAIHQWKRIQYITVTDVSLSFFTDLVPSIRPGRYTKGTPTYDNLLSAVRTYADGFFAIVQKYTPQNGDLAEQFSKVDGSPLSARKLTWSYASFLSAKLRRDGILGQSWNSASSKLPATQCVGRPICTSLTFSLLADSIPESEQVYVVGSVDQLVTVDLPTDMPFEFKFIRKWPNQETRWQPGSNFVATSAANCGEKVTVNSSVEWQPDQTSGAARTIIMTSGARRAIRAWFVW
ncbi:glycoside hydrolase family 15 protein [Pleomassaria siparia CBS 279.74]|uniref:Glucoamylase n=1 Tax=Pleomassaria siparia CBS 279.74 TaxID=1314801 RepID=A0A6G1JXJ8_9PLEO|nr:glycoside hydrolase family 15 protein [Pleomassaria siparia CBS 279.74]